MARITKAVLQEAITNYPNLFAGHAGTDRISFKWSNLGGWHRIEKYLDGGQRNKQRGLATNYPHDADLIPLT